MAEWLQSISEWFWPRFDPNKCKLYLKSAVVRMNLKKKKGQEQVKQMEKEIGDLAKQEKEDLARLRVERLVRDKRMLEAYDMLELMCEIVVSRLQLINMYPAVPEDLVEPLYTLTWASLRLAIPEFKHLAFQFKLKYGEEWVQDALNNTSHYVNEELIERLSVCCADQDTVEEEMCRISPVPAKSSSFELAAFDGDPGVAPPSYLSAFSPAAGAGPGAPPTWAYTNYPGGPAPVAAQPQMPLGPQPQLPAPYLGQPQQHQQPQQQPYQQQPPHYVQPYQPTVQFPAPATALPPSVSSMLPPPQVVSAAPAGSAPSPVLQPFVLPELDFGDWSSPLGTTTTQGLAFPHVASTSAAPTSSPFPSSSSALSTASSSPSLAPSSTSTITTTSTTSVMAPTSSPAPHEVDPALMFPAIPSDNPDPAKTTSALPPPAVGGDDSGGAAPGGATDEEEFDELSARFEALKRGL